MKTLCTLFSFLTLLTVAVSGRAAAADEPAQAGAAAAAPTTSPSPVPAITAQELDDSNQVDRSTTKQAWMPAPSSTPAPTTYDQERGKKNARLGIAFLITAGVAAVLGATFVGLAKNASEHAVSNGAYDPSAQRKVTGFEATDTVLFTVGALSFATGMVLVCDH